MIQMNFALARLNHQVWKMRLRSFLKGTEQMQESEAVSHTDCDLGKWIYSEGLSQYGQIAEMQQLEKTHADLHRAIRQIVTLKHANKVAEANLAYEQIAPLSGEIVSLLTTIEQKVKQAEMAV